MGQTGKRSRKFSPLGVMLVIIALYSALNLLSGGFRSFGTTTVGSLAETRAMVKLLGGSDAAPPIIAFVTSWCPYCRALEKDLQSQGIAYVHADIEADSQAGALFQRVTGSRSAGVPQILVGTTLIPGYNPVALRAALQNLKTELRGNLKTELRENLEAEPRATD